MCTQKFLLPSTQFIPTCEFSRNHITRLAFFPVSFQKQHIKCSSQTHTHTQKKKKNTKKAIQRLHSVVVLQKV